MIKHRLNELEAQNAALLARVEALEALMAAWLPEAPQELDEPRPPIADELPAPCPPHNHCDCGEPIPIGHQLCVLCWESLARCREVVGYAP